jgi:hypothetical protein
VIHGIHGVPRIKPSASARPNPRGYRCT